MDVNTVCVEQVSNELESKRLTYVAFRNPFIRPWTSIGEDNKRHS